MEPIAASLPVCSTNEQAARTFGPIDPSANSAPSQLRRRRPTDRTLVGGAPPAVDGVDISHDEQRIGVQVKGEESARVVLVDDGLDADELAARRDRGVGVHHGDATAAGAGDDRVVLEQPLDRLDAEDPSRRRRGDHTAHVVAVRFECPALVRGQGLGLGLGVDRADGLGRVAERGVVLVDLDHGQQGSDPLVRWEQVAELLLDEVADHALGLRAEDVQRVGVDLLVRRSLEREQTDLRAVAVRDDQLVVGRQRGKRPACGSHVHTLVLCGQRLTPAEEGVAAQRDDDPHLSRPASRRALP